MKMLIAAVLSALVLTGCTDNTRARSWGGTSSLKKPNESWQLVNITWKENSLWALWYEPSTNKCFFKEDSSFGAIQGTVVIEKCDPVLSK